MNLDGRKVLLRAIEEDDLEMLRDMANDSEIERLVCGFSYPVSKYQQRKWFEEVSNDKQNVRYVIETKEDGAVGFASIMAINWKNSTCLVGLKLCNKNLKSKGIGSDTVMTIMRYIFDELQLNRAGVNIIEYNVASMNLFYNKLGWKQEGIKRQFIFNNGKYHNLMEYGFLKNEYYELVNRIHYWTEEDETKIIF